MSSLLSSNSPLSCSLLRGWYWGFPRCLTLHVFPLNQKWYQALEDVSAEWRIQEKHQNCFGNLSGKSTQLRQHAVTMLGFPQDIVCHTRSRTAIPQPGVQSSCAQRLTAATKHVLPQAFTQSALKSRKILLSTVGFGWSQHRGNRTDTYHKQAGCFSFLPLIDFVIHLWFLTTFSCTRIS